MTKKHTKKCSPSLAIKEMQIKAAFRLHLTQSEWQSLRKYMYGNVTTKTPA
jgi:hypothetical protein